MKPTVSVLVSLATSVLLLTTLKSWSEPPGFDKSRPGQPTIDPKHLDDRAMMVRDLYDYLARQPFDRNTQTIRHDRSLSLSASFLQTVKKKNATHIESIVNTGRFVGHVEQQLGVDVPEWWMKSLLNSTRDVSSFAPMEYTQFRPLRHESAIAARPAYRIDERSISAGAETIIDLRTLEKMFSGLDDKTIHYCSVAHDASNVLVAFYSDFPVPYVLQCIDRRTLKPVWTANVWAGGSLFKPHGRSSHVVELVISADGVLVFGCGSSAIYIEGFAMTSGKAWARFSSTFWDDGK
jgi:hypothetical protein